MVGMIGYVPMWEIVIIQYLRASSVEAMAYPAFYAMWTCISILCNIPEILAMFIHDQFNFFSMKTTGICTSDSALH